MVRITPTKTPTNRLKNRAQGGQDGDDQLQTVDRPQQPHLVEGNQPQNRNHHYGSQRRLWEVVQHRGEKKGYCYRQDGGHQLAELGLSTSIGVDLSLGEAPGRRNGLKEGANDGGRANRHILLVVVEPGIVWLSGDASRGGPGDQVTRQPRSVVGASPIKHR
jgi:hypothetical protein